MNKSLAFVILICITMMFTACSAPAETAEQSTAAEPAKAVDTGLTLEGIKKAAQDAGYQVEDVQDFQQLSEFTPVNGFNLVYKDELSEAHIPILEFKNADEAGVYAKQVNEAGYNLSIMNGRFLTITGAQYGIPVNDKETKILETLLNSKVMEYSKPDAAAIKPPKDFAGAYLQIDAISKALDELINKSVLLHDKEVPEAERMSNILTIYSPLSSMDLAFTSALSEDQVQLDAVVEVWEMFGCTDVKLKHDTPHNYILTGRRSGRDTDFEISGSFNPGTGSLRLIDIDGGEAFELYEFVPLGSDKYAFQTMYGRAIVEYKDGKINSFVYSVNKADKTLAYSADKDGIYEKGGPADEAWVSKAGEDSYDQFVTYDGAKLKIASNIFSGERVKLEIDVK